MSDLITIARFERSTECAVLKSRLEAAEILSYVQGGYSNLYSRHHPYPIELQVRSEHVTAAREIMRQSGYAVYTEESPEVPAFWRAFIRHTDKLPIVKNQLPIARFMILVGIVVILAVIILVRNL